MDAGHEGLAQQLEAALLALDERVSLLALKSQDGQADSSMDALSGGLRPMEWANEEEPDEPQVQVKKWDCVHACGFSHEVYGTVLAHEKLCGGTFSTRAARMSSAESIRDLAAKHKADRAGIDPGLAASHAGGAWVHPVEPGANGACRDNTAADDLGERPRALSSRRCTPRSSESPAMRDVPLQPKETPASTDLAPLSPRLATPLYTPRTSTDNGLGMGMEGDHSRLSLQWQACNPATEVDGALTIHALATLAKKDDEWEQCDDAIEKYNGAMEPTFDGIEESNPPEALLRHVACCETPGWPEATAPDQCRVT